MCSDYANTEEIAELYTVWCMHLNAQRLMVLTCESQACYVAADAQVSLPRVCTTIYFGIAGGTEICSPVLACHKVVS